MVTNAQVREVAAFGAGVGIMALALDVVAGRWWSAALAVISLGVLWLVRYAFSMD